MKNIVLVTSIAPKGIENQKMALDSWINAGFKIISCNIKEEIELVEKKFPQVEFVEMKRDGRKIMGKPCPYIYDMLQVAREKSEDICGIVNSDIHLLNFSEEMYIYIKEQAQNQILFMRRNDVDTLDDVNRLNFDMFFGGIDVFIFHKNVLNEMVDDGLLIGQAMWDYWLPIMFSEKGRKIKEITNPMIFHIKHAIRWNDNITNEISWKICQKYFPEVKRENAIYFLKNKFFQLVSALDMGICNVSDEIAKRKVLLVCEAEIEGEMSNQISLQSHKNIAVADCMDNVSEYDYVIKIPYMVSLCYSFVDTVLWIIENFNVPFIKIMMYIRGNRTDNLHIENCCNKALKRLNCELQSITVLKKGYTLNAYTLPQLCTTYLCSIWIEEDEETIWKRDGFCGKTLVYPAGYMARLWVRRYKDIATQLEILGFVDSSKSMYDTFAENLPVYSPDIVLQKEKYDKIVIVSNIYQEEIYNMLKEKVQEKKLIIWNEFSLNNIDKNIRR